MGSGTTRSHPDRIVNLFRLFFNGSYHDDAERLAIEAAIAEMRHLAQIAPDGQVISLCEKQALDRGRSLLRGTLQDAVQARIDLAEQKGGPPASAPARSRAGSTSSGATATGI
jgi:hypothetical protein